MTTVCPKCQKDDRIARLPAIIQAGRASGSYAGPSGGVTYSDGKFGGVGGWTILKGSITTDLARVLAPPIEPRQRGGLGAWWILIFLCSMWVCALPVNLVTNDGSVAVHPAVVIISLGLGLAAVFFIFRYFIGVDRQRKASAKETYLDAKSRWDSAIAKWNRCYYCERDGIVFDPETDTTCEPNKIQEFIYS